MVPADAYSVELVTGGELTRWTYSEVGGLDRPRSLHRSGLA